MDRADVFVLLDDVQYKKNEWQNRNKIRNPRSSQWLTVPVHYRFGQKINEVRVNNNENWRAKHYKSLDTNYSRARHFGKYASFFRESYDREWDLLEDVNFHFIEYLKDSLGIKTVLARSSSFGVRGRRTRKLVNLCRHLKADTYISGAGGKEYLDMDLFRKSGIKLEFQEYVHPAYEQVYDGFQPYMSVVDLLFCHGKKSLHIIREGRKR